MASLRGPLPLDRHTFIRSKTFGFMKRQKMYLHLQYWGIPNKICKHAEGNRNLMIHNLRSPKPKSRILVLAGTGTTADGQSTQDVNTYPSMISWSNRQSLVPSETDIVTSKNQLLSFTIDGLGSDADFQRLQAQLKEINGVMDIWLSPLMEGGIRGGFVTANLQVDERIPALLLVKEIQNLDSELLVLPYKCNSWVWRGHKINFGVAGCGKPVILVHGFGGNAGHFARLIPHLSENHRVYAIDLLGFGASDKPQDANYGPDLWAELLCDFTKEFAEEGAVLIGNSIGSLTSLTAAAVGGENLFRGLVLLNCAGAMNRKGLTQDDPLIRLLSPIFLAVEYLLQRRRVADFLFNRVSIIGKGRSSRKHDDETQFKSDKSARNRDESRTKQALLN